VNIYFTTRVSPYFDHSNKFLLLKKKKQSFSYSRWACGDSLNSCLSLTFRATASLCFTVKTACRIVLESWGINLKDWNNTASLVWTGRVIFSFLLLPQFRPTLFLLFFHELLVAEQRTQLTAITKQSFKWMIRMERHLFAYFPISANYIVYDDGYNDCYERQSIIRSCTVTTKHSSATCPKHRK
jgi:uncharacterized membrane protein